jgi:hypothetical protein
MTMPQFPGASGICGPPPAQVIELPTAAERIAMIDRRIMSLSLRTGEYDPGYELQALYALRYSVGCGQGEAAAKDLALSEAQVWATLYEGWICSGGGIATGSMMPPATD